MSNNNNDNNKLTKWNPWTIDKDEFLTPFDSFFDNYWDVAFPTFRSDFGVDFFSKGSYPKVDVVEYEDRVEVEAEVPGLKKENVSVEVVGDSLVISGKKVESTEDKDATKGKYLRKELKKSAFQRSFAFGDNLDKNSVNAVFKDGVLKVSVKKITPTKPEVKKVEITDGK